MDLQDEIAKLQQRMNEIDSSDLSPGVKSDLRGILSNILDQATSIKPVYDNIDAVRNNIVDPTNRQIKQSFDQLTTTNSKLGKRSTVLSVISIMFGVVGLALTALQFIPALSGSISDKGRNATTTSGISNAILRYGWSSKLSYPALAESVPGVTEFNLSLLQGVITLAISQDFHSHKRLSQKQVDVLSNTVIGIMTSANDPRLTQTTVHFIGYDYESDVWRSQLRFTAPPSVNYVPTMHYNRGDSSALLVLPIEAPIASVDSELPNFLSAAPVNLISNTVRLLQTLTSHGFTFSIDQTLGQRINVLQWDGELSPVIVFTQTKT